MVQNKTFAPRGNIIYSKNKDELCVFENSYVICADGQCLGVFEVLPKEYEGIPCTDYVNSLIFPGMVDLHVHAPQYSFRGLGMDLELIDWLNTHTFPEEAKYSDPEYAGKAYDIFTEDLMKSATTRACIFATIHGDATKTLMEKLEKAGFCGYVGKVNMDRNSPENLCETSAGQALADTKKWLEECAELKSIRPILTPRFIPSCTDELMKGLAGLQKEYRLPVQSHLSENPSEIKWVSELCPESECYGDAYDRFGMFGGDAKTVMAHCVYSSPEEIRLMKEKGVFVAHCPESNANLSSGIAPVRTYLEEGMNVGLGTDVAAGSSLSVMKAMTMAIQCSKMRWRYVDDSLAPLSVAEAFYMATKGGGAFFGKVGSFEPGYEFDAVVFDDTTLKHPQPLSVQERTQRLIYLAGEEQICAKYIAGKKVR